METTVDLEVEYRPGFDKTVKKPKIAFAGPRAVGKTSIGRKISGGLAEFLKGSFIDLDDYIEHREGTTISEMEKERGWRYFRERESEYLEEILTGDKYNIIGLGGGANVHDIPEIREKNVEVLRKHALTICLLPYPDIGKSARILSGRLGQEGETENKPSLTGDKDAVEEVEDVLRQRMDLYKNNSDVIIYTEKEPIDVVAAAVLQVLGEQGYF